MNIKDSDILAELKEIYGKERVGEQHKIEKSTLIPDFVVYKSAKKEEILLVIETTAFDNFNRRKEDFRKLKKCIEEVEADYGALISEQEKYVFKNYDYKGKNYEVTISGFPETDKGKSKIASYVEFRRLCMRAKSLAEIDLTDILEILLLKFEADNQKISFEKVLRNQEKILNSLKERNPSLKLTEFDEKDVLTVLGVFNRVSFANSSQEVLEKLPKILMGERYKHNLGVSREIAKELLDSMNLEGVKEVTIPFSRYGNLSRELARVVDHVKTIEVNHEANNVAIFFDELLNYDIERKNQNPLKVIRKGEIPNLISIPPMGMNSKFKEIKGYDLHPNEKVEETLINIGLKNLSEGGKIYAVVSPGVLFRRSSKWLREKMIEEGHIRRISEIKSPILSSTSVSTAIISLEKGKKASEVKIEILREKDGSLEIEKQLSVDYKDLRKTMNPSNLIHWKNWKKKNKEVEEDFVRVGDRAKIKSGNRKPEGKTNKGIPFIGLRGYEGDKLSEKEAKRKARNGDLLLSVRGEKTVTAIPKKTVVPSQSWAIIRFNDNYLDLEKLSRFFHSDLGNELLESIKKGVTIPRINLSDLREIEIPIQMKKDVQTPENFKKIEDDYAIVYRSH